MANRNEQTSDRVKSFAGKLTALAKKRDKYNRFVVTDEGFEAVMACAGSALTQAKASGSTVIVAGVEVSSPGAVFEWNPPPPDLARADAPPRKKVLGIF